VEKQQLIFEMFNRAEPYTTRKYGGTGLGLAIVQQVLRMFNSTIRLDSSLGNGSKFSFDIICKTAEHTSTTIEEMLVVDLSNLKVLVAEDNDINRLVLEKQLTNLGVKTFVMATDGKQAYEHWMVSEFDVVLMDLDMPGWNGYDAVNKMRSSAFPTERSYLVAFTASVHEQQHIISQKGFDDYLYKPVTMNALKHTLEKGVVYHQNKNIVPSR